MSIHINVHRGNLQKAMRSYKNALYRTRLVARVIEKEHYEKPSAKRRRKHRRAVHRQRNKPMDP